MPWLGWCGHEEHWPWRPRLSEVTRCPARAASPALSPGNRGTLGKTLSSFPFKTLPEFVRMERVLRPRATKYDLNRWFVGQERGSHPLVAQPPFSNKSLGPLRLHGPTGE